MKKLFIIITSVLMCSCAEIMSTYKFVQVLKTEPIDQTSMKHVAGGLMYENENFSIFYHTWTEGGNLTFSITNKSDKILYVDLENSFFVKNGIAFDYYVDRTIANSSAESSTKGSAVAIYNTMVSSESNNVTSSGTSIRERPIMAIPPQASKIISDYTITISPVLDCDLTRYPSDSASVTYTAENSPISYSNYLTYRIGREEEKVIENKFYVARVSNYAEPSFSKYVLRNMKPCQNLTNEIGEDYKPYYMYDVYDEEIQVDVANSFYVTYRIVTSKKLYTDKRPKNLIYSKEENGYIKGVQDEHEEYVRKLVDPFAKPE